MADAGGVSQRPLVVWRLLDGKPGHESQSLGLVRALERLRPVTCHDILADGLSGGIVDWFRHRFPAGQSLPAPDLIVGAGHATHWSLLCARRAFGGRTVALMKPSLPLRWFDWVVAPEHDDVTGRNVIVTRGVLNAMRPGQKQPGSVLLMIGGESKHFLWENEDVLAQISRLMEALPGAILTDSRRTPEVLRRVLATRYGAAYYPWERCPPGWLLERLAEVEAAWVSEDSVSMIYEALSAGCAVGLVALPAVQESRLARGLRGLEQAGLVTSMRLVGPDYRLARGNVVLAEADRVASCLLMVR